MKFKTNSFERYKEEICSKCKNENIDLCKITRRVDNTVKCDNYERCLTNKCKTCSNNNKCFKEENKNESKSNK